MPLYEYQCDACGHRFERIQKFSDPLVADCPECGGVPRKLLSSPAIQFKGSGWYITDYARGGKKGDEPVKPDTKAPAAAEKGGDKTGGTAKGKNGSSGAASSTPSSSSSAASSTTSRD